MCNIAVLVSGSGSNLQALIDKTKEGYINGKIQLVVSDSENAYALTRAEDNGISSHYIKNDSVKLLELLKENQIDLIVLAGYLPILPSNVVSQYEKRIVNIHPSLIPKYCGKGFHGEHVHRAVLKAGEKKSGATVHYVDSGIDTGQIICQKAVEVKADDTVESLQKRVLEVEHQILADVVKQLCEN